MDHITDFVGGTDIIKFVAGTAFTDDTARDLSGSADLAAAALASLTAVEAANAGAYDGAGDAVSFVYDGRTYLLVEEGTAAAAFNNGDDLIVDITGVSGTIVVGDIIA